MPLGGEKMETILLVIVMCLSLLGIVFYLIKAAAMQPNVQETFEIDSQLMRKTMWQMAAGMAWFGFCLSIIAIWAIGKKGGMELTIWNALAALLGIPMVTASLGVVGCLYAVWALRMHHPLSMRKQAKREKKEKGQKG
jgi:hypothetical protein